MDMLYSTAASTRFKHGLNCALGCSNALENCKEKGMEDQPVDVEDQVAQGQLQTAQPLHWEIPLLDPSKQLTYKETFKNIQRKMMPKRPVLQNFEHFSGNLVVSPRKTAIG